MYNYQDNNTYEKVYPLSLLLKVTAQNFRDGKTRIETAMIMRDVFKTDKDLVGLVDTTIQKVLLAPVLALREEQKFEYARRLHAGHMTDLVDEIDECIYMIDE